MGVTIAALVATFGSAFAMATAWIVLGWLIDRAAGKA
jgi:hypothetical protein